MEYTDATDKCDYNDLANEWNYWYKVSGQAGNALAAGTAPTKDRCGTTNPVYLAENHPTPSDGQVTLKVCMVSGNKDCFDSGSIQVINCGAFYLYKLVQIRSNCSPAPWRYCTNGETGEKSKVRYLQSKPQNSYF